MTPRQRYFEAILFGKPDKYPLYPGGPRESTIAAWKTQGLPQNVYYLDYALDQLGIPREAALKFHYSGVNFKMIPEFDVEILDHKDGHYIIRDWMGAVTEIADNFDETYLRQAKDFVTRKWHKFPVENRQDWEDIKWRYNANDPSRISPGEAARCQNAIDNEYLVSLTFNGIFWQLREWCGFENLCILMLEDPDFVMEMAEFWTDFINQMLENIKRLGVKIDRLMISEDMAYKAHSMISPEMTRKFILPAYYQWVPKLKEQGVSVIELDSDGCVDELIPIWIEAGIHCCSPIEVAAYCDILEYRRLYGKSMAYIQGIDKRIMAKGGKELEEHINHIVPEMFKLGGFIPGCDHGVPPDISWPNFLETIKHLAKHSGWL